MEHKIDENLDHFVPVPTEKKAEAQEEELIEKPVDRKTWKRLKKAQQAIQHVNNEILPYGAGNQADDVNRSRGVSTYRAFQAANKNGRHRTDKDATDPDVGRTAAQQSIIANEYHAAVCDTYSYATFNHLRKTAKDQPINR